MKKNYFLLLVASLFVVQGFAQQVEEQQRSLITKRTADWCPFCGTWGWNFFIDALEDNDDKAVFMAAHYDGGLSNPVAEEITENFGGGYQPRFFLNETDFGVSSGNAATKLDALKIEVDANYLQAPVANVGFDPIYVNGEIQVAAKVKFFQAAQGEYYLGIYLLEDDVVAYQASLGNMAVHKRLFRFSFDAAAFGQPVANGDVAAGQEFDFNFELIANDPAGANYEVMGIIWKKESDKYKVVNVWSTENIQTVSATTAEAVLQNVLNVFPTVVSTSTTIHVQMVENQQVASIQVFDTNGRLVATVFEGSLQAGATDFELNSKVIGGAGLYFVRMKSGSEVLVKKVVFQ